ncbi:FAD-dependent oxidoreductase [Lactobacillus sp. LL6]|uniref:FAD-dependent oxidoreductase n=1 Tax=Lactobacillus sp. LL6 TaxID=2596827 RepID=UPI0011863251|nr:FAD-dependent oxidoreductase [Lactobacillus sp. LL6]TSO25586.1 FAD-dependent oxidoreductase [Lactobacillus sp. LL6]
MTKKIIKAQANGRNGKIDIDIDINNDEINNIKITQNSETPAIFNQAFDKLKNEVLNRQSFDVDAVSGATIMTQAILDSGKKALEENNIKLNSKPINTEHEDVEINVDVAVIGSGMAGLMAASRALSMGKSVIVLEKNGYLGGATVLNGSNVVGTGSRISKKLFGKLANEDSPEKLVADITRESRGTNYPMLSNLLADNIGRAVDFIADFANLTYQKAETQTVEHSINRQIEMPSQSSYELITKVAKAFKEKGGRILLDASVEKLNKENGILTSLIAEGKHQTTTINFKSLILSAGGWGARDYKAHKTSIPYYGPMTSTGDYFDFAKNMNLVTRNLNWYKVYPHGLEVEPGIAKLTTYSTKEATDLGAIFVNKLGKRIVNESAPYTYFRDAIGKQPGQVAYIVMDKRTWNKFYELLLKYGFTKEEIQSYFDLEGKKSPVLVKGTLEEAAKKAGIDYKTLQETIDNYNEMAKAGYDPEFGRDKKYLHEYEGDTYYIIEQKRRFCTTLGGYETNNHMQLLDINMQPVENFYASGEIIGGANGHDSMPSMMNSWSYASGFVAGTMAADNTNSYQRKVNNEIEDPDAVTGASEE